MSLNLVERYVGGQPSGFFRKIPGRCPRLIWSGAFGPGQNTTNSRDTTEGNAGCAVRGLGSRPQSLRSEFLRDRTQI